MGDGVLGWWKLLDGLVRQQAARENARLAAAQCRDEAQRRAEAVRALTARVPAIPTPRDARALTHSRR